MDKPTRTVQPAEEKVLSNAAVLFDTEQTREREECHSHELR
jgi:hypothetical protein